MDVRYHPLLCNYSFCSRSPKDRNCTYRITLGNIQYAHHNEKMSAGEAVGQVLSGALTGKTSIEATKYEDDVKSSIIKGLSEAHRFRYNDGLLQLKDVVEEGNVVVNALITNINAASSSDTWKDKDNNTKVTTTYTGEVDDISRCKVQSGGKDIKAALDAGQQLRVMSID